MVLHGAKLANFQVNIYKTLWSWHQVQRMDIKSISFFLTFIILPLWKKENYLHLFLISIKHFLCLSLSFEHKHTYMHSLVDVLTLTYGSECYPNFCKVPLKYVSLLKVNWEEQSFALQCWIYQYVRRVLKQDNIFYYKIWLSFDGLNFTV